MSLQSDHINSDVSQLNSLSDDLSQSVLPSGDVNLVSSTDNNATDPITAPSEDAVSVVKQVQDTDVKHITVSSADLDSGDVAGTLSIGSSFVKVGLSSEESECKEEPACKENNNAHPAENGDTTESSELTHQVEEITADGLTTENEKNSTEVEDQNNDENIDAPPSQTTESCEILEAPSQVSVDDTSLYQEAAEQNYESFEQIPDDSLDGSEVPTQVDESFQSITSQSLGSFQQVESLTEDSFSIIEQSLDSEPNKQQNDGEGAEIPLKEGTVENIEPVQATQEVKNSIESVEPVQDTQEVNKPPVVSVEPVQAIQEVNNTPVESVEPVQATQEVNNTPVESVEPVQATQEVNNTPVESVEPVQATQEVNNTSVESVEPVQAIQEVNNTPVESVEPVQATQEVNNTSVESVEPVQATQEVIEKTAENVEQTPVTEEVNTTSEGKGEEAKEKKETEEDETLDILGNDLLKKKVVVKGLGPDSRPERGQEVTIQYESSKEDGSVYEPKKSLTFIIADGDVCEALDLSVNLMQKGESCMVVADVKYCWNKNDQTRPSSLPQSGTLTYTIQLTTVEDGPYNTSVNIEHRLKWAENKKQQGNSFYGRKNFLSSVVSYKKCLAVLKQALHQENIDEKVQARVRELAVKCYNNVAASHLQLAEWGRAVTACTDAEALDSNNVKTLLRKGKALSQLGKDADAVGVLKKAAKIDPNAKDVQSELVRVTKKMTAQKDAQKKMCERMFGGGQTNKKVEEEEPSSSSIFSWKSPFVYGSSAMMLAAVIIGLFMYQKQ